MPVTMNYKLLLLLLLLPFSFHAQVKKVKATIVNPGSLYSTYDFEADAGMLKPAIKLQGGSDILSDIIRYSNQANWPAGMKELDSRLAKKELIKKYTAYKIVKTADYCILLIPAAENKQMAQDMRPARDIYFVMELMGADFEGNHPSEKQEEAVEYNDYDGDEEDSWTKVDIVNPGDMYSTFNLKDNASIRRILLDSGILSETEFETIVSRAKETGWPSGISTLDKRLAVKEKIKNYTAFYITEFGDENEYMLIWIPQEENTHMPKEMQPQDFEGIYFVIKSSGVSFDDF